MACYLVVWRIARCKDDFACESVNNAWNAPIRVGIGVFVYNNSLLTHIVFATNPLILFLQKSIYAVCTL